MPRRGFEPVTSRSLPYTLIKATYHRTKRSQWLLSSYFAIVLRRHKGKHIYGHNFRACGQKKILKLDAPITGSPCLLLSACKISEKSIHTQARKREPTIFWQNLLIYKNIYVFSLTDKKIIYQKIRDNINLIIINHQLILQFFHLFVLFVVVCW